LLLFSIYLRRGLELWLVSVSCRKITINLWLEQLSSVKFRLNFRFTGLSLRIRPCNTVFPHFVLTPEKRRHQCNSRQPEMLGFSGHSETPAAVASIGDCGNGSDFFAKIFRGLSNLLSAH